MAPHLRRRTDRRRRIGATVTAVAIIGVAGGYGTYAAFTDTTTLNGTATAGTVQLNDDGADSRSFTVSDLVPGDAPSICFDVAAPTAENSQPLDVTLTAERTTSGTPSAADDALAGALDVELESATAADGDYLTLDGAAGTTRTLLRTETCSDTVLDPDTIGITGVGNDTVTGIASLGAAHGTVTLDPGTKQRYRITVALPASAPDAAQGGTASFALTWTGSAGAS